MSDEKTLLKALLGISPKSIRRPGIATDLSGGADFNIFNIANDPIWVTSFFGVVKTVIGAGLAVPRLQHTPTGGAQTPLCAAAASIAADAVGTIYTIPDGQAATQLAPAAALGAALSNEFAWSAVGDGWFILPGIMAITNAVASTGIIDWYMSYVPYGDAEVTIL
jgi:hypothetical protein